MIYLQNEGEIDLRAITTFGVSVKEIDNPIGYFGTGFKYAIAIILRERGSVTIYRGLEKYEFTSRPDEIRGKEFQIVYMNDEPLAFTLDLGQKWEMWQAFRELYSNMLDEGGYASPNEIEPEAGKTTLVIRSKSFDDCYYNRSEIFLKSEPDFEWQGINVHKKASDTIYYRGIRVAKQNCLFTYNLTQANLTEDRTLDSSAMYSARYAIATGYLTKCLDENMLRVVLVAEKGCIEHELDFDMWEKPTETFLDIVAEMEETNFTAVNKTAIRVLHKQREKTFSPKTFEPTNIESQMLERAIMVLTKIGYEVDKYPIILARDLGEGIMGLAKDKNVYLTRLPFQLGTKQVASTLLEEFIHIDHNAGDFTNKLQTLLFDTVIGMAETYILGEPL